MQDPPLRGGFYRKLRAPKKTPCNEKMAVWRRPGLLWQSSPWVPSGVMVYLRVLARAGMWAVCARPLAFLPPQVLLPCRFLCVEWLWLFWNIMARPLLGKEDSTSSPCWL
jgi:hypothetical protein